MLNINPNFLAGGNATFTVSNPQGEHYTFKVRKPREETPWFVSLLTGPDNENSFTYLGVYNPERAEVRLTKASRFTLDSKPVRVCQWSVRQVHAAATLPEGYSIQHDGKCGRCGRKLTTPESLERGIGPECWEKMGG